MKKGPLVKVELRPGQFVKMYEADAITQGLVPAKKSKPAAGNKMVRPEKNKSQTPEKSHHSTTGEEDSPSAQDAGADQDDFAIIPGVGKATARALVAHGITTFDELAEADDLSFLSVKAIEAIEAWMSTREA